jgi:hypothetical protein|uniref:Uncharacterized protein n=1 Tax=Fagus sylvatica TaxID=28930 RepID=A0A2N9I1G8_FAGSY
MSGITSRNPVVPIVGAESQSQSQSLHNVFVYGSLLADEIVKVLLRRVPPSSSAFLNALSVSLSICFINFIISLSHALQSFILVPFYTAPGFLYEP